MSFNTFTYYLYNNLSLICTIIKDINCIRNAYKEYKTCSFCVFIAVFIHFSSFLFGYLKKCMYLCTRN